MICGSSGCTRKYKFIDTDANSRKLSTAIQLHGPAAGHGFTFLLCSHWGAVKVAALSQAVFPGKGPSFGIGIFTVSFSCSPLHSSSHAKEINCL
jgi:hypothetical protein